MNLENVWMFEGEAFYCPNQLLFLEPLFKHSGMDFEQFITAIKQGADKLERPRILNVNKDGIASVTISGPLMPNKSLLMQAMGGTSTSDINNAFQSIKHNPKVKGVFMQVNSPGGSAAGIDETASLIHEVNQSKPIVSQVTGTAASAAYYLASQSSKVFANSRTNMIGSVGTRLVVDDTSQAAAKSGVERVVIETGANKSIGLPGTRITADHKSHLQSQVNELQRFFEQSVKRGRPNIDINSINDGATYLAEQSQKRGLIDGIQSPQRSAEILHALIRVKGKRN